MDTELEENQEKPKKSFQWYLYVVIIPILFAITVALIVSLVAGINVVKTAQDVGKKIPVVGNLLKSDSPKTAKTTNKEVVDLQSQLKDKAAQIAQLQKQLDNKDRDIQRGKLENSRLQKEMDDSIAGQANNKRALKDIIKTYETMSAKTAAPVITQMNDKEAMKILSAINADSLAAIMEKMAPKDAAKYTQLLTNGAEKTN